MGYYIRVLARTAEIPTATRLRERLRADQLAVNLEVSAGDEGAWIQIVASHAEGTEICVIERNPVVPGELGSAELKEFIEDIQGCVPVAAVEWLGEYLPRVKTIYAFQILHKGADQEGGWQAIHSLQGEIWAITRGILQADYEGFSNEEGYHILRQFSDRVNGLWNMAVRGPDGTWIPFEMDLANEKQREEFKAGKVPSGAELL
jgi:hypothetical protein